MLIKIPDADDIFVDKLKRQTGQSTGSKAYAKAAAEFDYLSRTVDWQAKEMSRLQSEIDRLNDVIQGARAAAAHLLEQTAQEDMFSVPKRTAGDLLQDPAGGRSGTNPGAGESPNDFLARIKGRS